MSSDHKFGLLCLAVLAVVGLGGIALVAWSPSAPSSTCPGECCPCDAVDAHVVAKWLERSDRVVLAVDRKFRYFQCAEKNGMLVLFAGDEIGEMGDAPASIGELEGTSETP